MSGGEVEFAVGDFLVVFNDLIESVFIEIPKNVLKRDENMIFLQEVICSCLMLCLQIFRKKNHTENKLCYLMGDYINLLNYESHDLTANFVDTMYSYSYLPLINRPTRVTQQSALLIDSILTKNHTALLILSRDFTDWCFWSFPHHPYQLWIYLQCKICVYIATFLLRDIVDKNKACKIQSEFKLNDGNFTSNN